MTDSASARQSHDFPARPRPCLRIIDTDGSALATSRAQAIRYLMVQHADPVHPAAVLFRTWKTADIAGNGCGRCRECSAVHYGDGLSACGLPCPQPPGDAQAALDFSPDGL